MSDQSARSNPQPPPVLTTQLLIDLVTNTLDPGYAAAAARRGASMRRRWFERPAVALGCLLIGFTLVVAYIHTHRSAPQTLKVHADLVSRVRNAEEQNDALENQARRLSSELSQLRDRSLTGRAGTRLDRDQLLAGQIAVSGPGLEVVLDEPQATTPSAQPGKADPTANTATHILSDRDVRSVVNELWADGAEAISVNDIRLTPTSAIRFAGEAVLVERAPITPPYRIRAVGNADDLATSFAASDVASRYHTLASADGIRFEFTEHDRLRLPASAAVAPRYAHPPSTPSETVSPR